ncbi:MAG: hypothetical protein AAFZ18_31920, partial [Myxococcota bacterium]
EAWVTMGWVGDAFSDARLRIECNDGETQDRNTVPSEEYAVEDLDRSRLNAKRCRAGTVTVSCIGEEAERISELFQDQRGTFDFPYNPNRWYQSSTRRAETRPPVRYTFTISRSDLRERRFNCKFDD